MVRVEADSLTLSEYLDKYRGRRFIIVGKGPTPFRFTSLADVTDPIIFLNDTVQYEAMAPRSVETFFFQAHAPMGIYVTPDRLSTVVLPAERHTKDEIAARERAGQQVRVGGRIFAADYDLTGIKRVLLYQWGPIHDVSQLTVTRAEAVDRGELYDAGGIVHYATHFAWMCGATEIAYIGCDGRGTEYDSRIDNRSRGKSLGRYAEIRRELLRECGYLGVTPTFVRAPALEPVIPRLAHFVWFGKVPPWLDAIQQEFRDRNPDWRVRLWRQAPDDMPAELQTAMAHCKQVCQQADIMYIWLLYSQGGVVIDTDIVTFESFEPLRRYTPAWTLPHRGLMGRLTNGVMGSIEHSEFFRRAAERVVEIDEAVAAGTLEWKRCQYMNLLTPLQTAHPDEMHLLPSHLFYPWTYAERETAAKFWRAGEAERHTMLRDIRKRFTDGVWPYGVHLWGIDGSSKREV